MNFVVKRVTFCRSITANVTPGAFIVRSRWIYGNSSPSKSESDLETSISLLLSRLGRERILCRSGELHGCLLRKNSRKQKETCEWVRNKFVPETLISVVRNCPGSFSAKSYAD
jgi:hypothetical protein